MSNPAVTDSACVITPCFNAAPFLTACLESVASQGSSLRKHIVMDGGSNDGSVEILEAFARTHDHLVWRSERDRGQSDALNKALRQVDSRYFGWLNADDCYLPGALGGLLVAGRAEPTIIYGDYQVIDAAGNVLRRRRQPSFNYWDCLYSYLTVQNAGALFRTDVCRDTGGFDQALEFCMDYDLVLRLAARGRVEHVRRYAGSFRHHEGAKTTRLQEICKAETERLRLKVSGRSPRGLRMRYLIGKSRVAARMLFEGCMGSRLESSRVESGHVAA